MLTRINTAIRHSHATRRRHEAAFTLLEMAITVAIIAILTGLALLALSQQQQANARSAVVADVQALQSRIQTALVNNPTADPIIGYTAGNQNSVSVPAGGIRVLVTQGDSASTIKITNAVNDGTAATTATGTGNWAGYEITGTNSKVANWYYTYNSNTGKFYTNQTNNAANNPLPTRPPTISTASLPNGRVNNGYNQTVVASAQPAATFSATGLPTGLSMSAGGVITGTPVISGTYTVTVRAANSAGSDVATYTLVIEAGPTITTTSLPSGTVGTPYATTINATGLPAPTYALNNSTLPGGLSLNTSTGAITGTPTLGGSYNVTITATNTYGTDTKTFTLVINQAPAITTNSLSNGLIGSTYSQTVNATGYPSPTFTATGLPTGLIIGAGNGVISGTPTVNGTFSVTVTATNSTGNVSKTYSLYIAGQLATPTNVTTSRIFGNQATITWASVPNATSYVVTYSGGGSGSRTVTTTSITDTQGITAAPNTVGVSIVAKASGYNDSNAGTTNTVMPGYRATSGTVLTGCVRQDITAGVTATCAITSSDGLWTAVMQQDGNFVEYRNNLSAGTVKAFYATQTNGSNYYLSVQTDGNVVLYTSGNGGVKATDTSGQGTVRLDMQTDGNLAQYNPNYGGWATFNNPNGNTLFMQYVGGSNVSITDPSAETCDGATWHTYFGPGTSCSTDTANSGSKSFKVTTTGNNPEGVIIGPDGVYVNSGQTVLINMYIKGTAGEKWNIGGRQGDPYGEYYNSYVFTTNGTWQRISIIWTAGSNYRAPYIQTPQNAKSSGKVLYADDISVYVGYSQ